MSRVYRTPGTNAGNEPVRIVLASDKNFLPFCAATMASVLANSAREDRLVFYLLTDAELDPEDARRFEGLQAIHEFEHEVIVVDASRFERVRTTPGISVATYYRLMLPELMPRDVDKVLYLDCDLAVVDRVRKLYDVDVSDVLFVGIDDSIGRLYNEKFSVADDAPHVNGGVLLVNLAALREFDFAGTVSAYVEAHKYVIELGDQQILNTLFHDRIALVHPRWNVHGSMFDPGWRRKNVGVRNHYTHEDLRRAVLDPAIIHYTYHRKPWHSTDHPKSGTYLKYLAMTDYGERFAGLIAQERKVGDKLVRLVKRSARSGWNAVGGKALAAKSKKLGKSFSQSVARSSGVAGNVGSLNLKYNLSAGAACDHWLSTVASQAREEPRDIDAFTRGHEFAWFVGNASDSDINGGELQNYKNLLRTNRISTPGAAEDWGDCDGLFLCRWRPNDTRQLAVLQHAARSAKPLFLIETSFFAGCVTWAHRKARAEFRRPFGFIVDDMAYYYDATRPSRIRLLLADAEYRPSAPDLDRARSLITTIVDRKITKYNFMPERPASGLPDTGGRPIVLVVDQTYGDASIELGRASAGSFESMLAAAIEENPHADVLVKTHPDSLFEKSGRRGYFHELSPSSRVHLVRDKVNPHTLIEMSEKVYVVSSQFGFEALLHGKPVVCFGAPFYSGLGLTDDRGNVRPASVSRTVQELFHIACLEMSYYVDPRSGRYCSMEEALEYAVELRERYLTTEAAE